MLSSAALFLYALPLTSAASINWFSCTQNASVPVTCGTLEVPLDYTNTSSNETLQLQLVKVSAKKEPKKGSILFNPGGPGDSGRNWIAGPYAEAQLIATGGEYDLIGFDTRGTGNTIPFSCFQDATSRADSSVNTPFWANSSDAAIGQIWVSKTTVAENCYLNAKDIGELIGTAFVARVMMQIVDALDEDGLLRYWGFSYGTALGVTVAAMFPDRIDKIVLDGVLNAPQYYAGADFEELTDTDKTFFGFLEGCIADPSNCPLAQDGSTAEELSQKFYNYLWDLKFHPVVVGTDLAAGLINYDEVKYVIEQALYSTLNYQLLATFLHSLLDGNYTSVLEIGLEFFAGGSSIYPNNGFEAIWGIRCGDSALRASQYADVMPIIDEFFARSMLFGDIWPVYPLTCGQWPFVAKERFTDFSCVKTSNPLLFIGNTYDPFTPLVSAYNASANFEGSVVLEHVGFGHTSFGQPSLCTAKVVRSYFVNGTLPAPGTKCVVSEPLFNNETAEEAFAPISNFSKRAVVYREDDTELLDAVKILSRKAAQRQRF